ncbi:MAG: hypothetical protein HYS27_12990 [Deltaproteobacteria bacterium]|nr:hypothetical protein [Deltaproteobacteria bacterium]
MTNRLALTLPALSFAALLAAALSGCGDGHTPRLSNLRLDGQAPDSPLVLLLSFDFVDEDGDLADGVLDTFLNSSPTSAGPLPLLPIFIGSDVEPGASQGHLEFVLELSFADPPPSSGSSFTMGTRATDGGDNTSTTQELRLKLEY